MEYAIQYCLKQVNANLKLKCQVKAVIYCDIVDIVILYVSLTLLSVLKSVYQSHYDMLLFHSLTVL